MTDAKAGTVTVYVYGDRKDLDKGVAKAIDAKMLELTVKGEKGEKGVIKLAPAPDDASGKFSMYTGKHKCFLEHFRFRSCAIGAVTSYCGSPPGAPDAR